MCRVCLFSIIFLCCLTSCNVDNKVESIWEGLLKPLKLKNDPPPIVNNEQQSNASEGDPFKSEVRHTFKAYMDTADLKKHFIRLDHVDDQLLESLVSFYAKNNYELKWLHYYSRNQFSDSLIHLINNAEFEGLSPNDYRLSHIFDMENEVHTASGPASIILRLVELDIYHTALFYTYISEVANGRINPNKLDGIWKSYPKRINCAEILTSAFRDGDFLSCLNMVRPELGQYHLLQDELNRYMEISNKGGWEKLSDEVVQLQKNASSDLVRKLKERLYLEGFYSKLPLDSIELRKYGPDLELAVMKFQVAHGLEGDGEIGPLTLFYLNKDVEEKINKIRLNLERLRWHSADLGDTYILVNVPEFSLKLYEKDELQMEMKVIVGKEYNSTPIFRDTITYIVFSPDWTVPLSIARSKVLPMLKNTPEEVIAQNYIIYESWETEAEELDLDDVDWEVMEPHDFNFKVVQMPGENNALGKVKFMFPNPMGIYLHDTPTGYLFNKEERMFSHGCVRVEKPLELAEYLLKNNDGWNKERILKHINKDDPKDVILKNPMPIRLEYKTAWIDDNGQINFRDDVYGHDAIQLESL